MSGPPCIGLPIPPMSRCRAWAVFLTWPHCGWHLSGLYATRATARRMASHGRKTAGFASYVVRVDFAKGEEAES